MYMYSFCGKHMYFSFVLCSKSKIKTHQPSRSSEGCREIDAEQNKIRTGEKQGKHTE